MEKEPGRVDLTAYSHIQRSSIWESHRSANTLKISLVLLRMRVRMEAHRFCVTVAKLSTLASENMPEALQTAAGPSAPWTHYFTECASCHMPSVYRPLTGCTCKKIGRMLQTASPLPQKICERDRIFNSIKLNLLVIIANLVVMTIGHV